ncbi:uncharacterized protein [Dermacentor albipictus]|uniref:uncharacterized protein n=1 Tax=Dermacentor albipictus TaxID=60249 RepID=UPI0038FC3404
MTKASPSQGSDGKKPRPPWSTLSTRAAESRKPGWIPERDRREAGSSSGTKYKQSPLKSSSTKQRGDGGGVPPPSSRSADTQRPCWISERDWQEAGPSGVRQSPAKKLGPGSRPAKTARMQIRAKAVTATVSGISSLRRRAEEGVFRQSSAPANLSPGDLDREDDAGGCSGAPMEVDHAKLLSSAFDEVMRAASASIHMITSSCVAMSDPDQQLGNDSSS